MHFLECYALNCGLKIDRPFIEEEPCQIPDGDYLTFHGTHSFQSKSYNFWQEVIDFTKGAFPNLSIVQLGTESSERKYNNTENYLGKTNFNQSAYLMKRAKLHFGIDSSDSITNVINTSWVCLLRSQSCNLLMTILSPTPTKTFFKKLRI